MNFFENLDRSIAPVVSGLDNRARRHAAVAANVANADTPGYRAIDVTFGGHLERARLALSTTHPGHRGAGSGSPGASSKVVFSGGLERRDRNDVDIDREMSKLARNQIEYQFLARRLSGKFAKLREAITGRAG